MYVKKHKLMNWDLKRTLQENGNVNQKHDLIFFSTNVAFCWLVATSERSSRVVLRMKNSSTQRIIIPPTPATPPPLNPFMSKIERKYCLISTSHLTELCLF